MIHPSLFPDPGLAPPIHHLPLTIHSFLSLIPYPIILTPCPHHSSPITASRPFTIHHLRFTASRPFALHHSRFTIYYLPFTACYPIILQSLIPVFYAHHLLLFTYHDSRSRMLQEATFSAWTSLSRYHHQWEGVTPTCSLISAKLAT